MNQRYPLTPDTEPPVTPAAPLPAKPPLAEPLSMDQITALQENIVKVLHTCFDPEIPVNIYELGLIYDILIEPSGAVRLNMTLTSPGCPVAGSLPGDVERKIHPLENVTSVKVDVVWDPPWTKDRMSEAAKLHLGIDD
jgi:FeS assembly SUF system protein